MQCGLLISGTNNNSMAEWQFSADTVESTIRNPALAQDAVGQRSPKFLALLRHLQIQFRKKFSSDSASDSLVKSVREVCLVAFARMAQRNGTWGNGKRYYHDETHIIDILDGRLSSVCGSSGSQDLKASDWILLVLFAVTHDLRQTEEIRPLDNIGANELASIEEAHRLMLDCGISFEEHAYLFDTLSLMIKGSTFVNQRRPGAVNGHYNPPPIGGSLAPEIAHELIEANPDWQSNSELKSQINLVLLASDLDTANVAEPHQQMILVAIKLCLEIEEIIGRDIKSTESAEYVFEFLTRRQELFFFDLHRFYSDIGRSAFATGKEKNAKFLKDLISQARESLSIDGKTGEEVVAAYQALVQGLTRTHSNSA